MLDNLVLRPTLERVLEVTERLDIAVVGVHESESKQTSTLAVVARAGSIGSRQVGLEDRSSLREVSLVDDSEGGGGRELGPVGRAGQPVEVLAEEEVRGRSCVGEGVHERHGRVVDGVARFEDVLHVLLAGCFHGCTPELPWFP